MSKNAGMNPKNHKSLSQGSQITVWLSWTSGFYAWDFPQSLACKASSHPFNEMIISYIKILYRPGWASGGMPCLGQVANEVYLADSKLKFELVPLSVNWIQNTVQPRELCRRSERSTLCCWLRYFAISIKGRKFWLLQKILALTVWF